MKKILNNFYFLLLVFFILNVLQSIFTPISKDEAYYWMYAQNLDWGYFDHPPMIGLLIKMGSMLLSGTAGVRLAANLLTVLTLILVWNIIPESDRKKKHAVMIFFFVVFSMPVFNIYGFISTPDVPLLFFSALYLFVFLRFLKHKNLVNALFLGLVAGLLMYSKYHGAFLILFCLIPNYRLLWNKFFILAGLVGIGLYLPHLYWQYEHEFISIRYHLIQRTDGFNGGENVMKYFLNTFLIFNPFFIGYFFFNKQGAKDKVILPAEHRFVLWGFLLFFLFTSLRDHVEPQWVGVAAIPFSVILVHAMLQKETPPFKFMKYASASLLLIIAIRLVLVLPLPLNTEFHKQGASFFNGIKQRTNGSKAVFINSYYDAAKYTYYTGDSAFSYNCYDYRKNQYDIWDYEATYHKSDVALITGYEYPWIESSFEIEGQVFYYESILRFPMINKVTGLITEMDRTLLPGQIYPVSFSIHNPYEYPLVFDDADHPLRFFLVFQVGLTRYLTRIGTVPLSSLKPGKSLLLKGYFMSELPKGEYRLAVGLQAGLMSPVLITEKIEVVQE